MEKNTTLDNFDRINYKESELENVMGPYYNNTMNHKMKDKDTNNKINPTFGLWPNSVVFETANQRMKPSSYWDNYLKQEFNIRKNPFKTWEEENTRFKNMNKKISKEGKNEVKESKK